VNPSQLLARFQDSQTLDAAGWLLGSLVLALIVRLMFHRLVEQLTQRTETDLDDLLAENLRNPAWMTVLAGGTWYATASVELPAPLPYALTGLLITITVLAWTTALARVAEALLDWLVEHRDRYHTVVTRRTLPVFDITAKTVIYGGTVYFLFLAWDVDLTAWLASAGIIGVAVGFASQDTLSNLVAGVFILADAPYKLGDYLVLESGERGEVTEIGIRTTRLMTRDDVEIIVPNKVMANASITNQSGGAREAFRVRIPVGVAYGSDVDQVRAELENIAATTEDVATEPMPRVRFREFGASSLDFELLCWVDRPAWRGRVKDQLLTTIYKRFDELDIEIPYSKHDVYLYPQPPEPPE
jgi:small-conductance mechanosensitive channel